MMHRRVISPLIRLLRWNLRNGFRQPGQRGDDAAMHHEPEKGGAQEEQRQRGYQPMLKIRERGKSNICWTLHHHSPPYLRYGNVAVEPIAGLRARDEIASPSLKSVMRSKDEAIIIFRAIEKGENPLGRGY